MRRCGKDAEREDARSGKFVRARGSIFYFIRSVVDYLGLGKSVRGAIKGVLPYALVRRWQKRIYGK